MIAIYKIRHIYNVCILLVHIEIGKETTASIVILKWYFQNQTTLIAAAVQEKFK